MAKTTSSNEIDIQKSITAINRDIINIQGFITQEIIKNIQANGGGVFSSDDPVYKEQINSLLNADPTSEANKGKAVLSFKATEIGIEEKLKSLEEKGASTEELARVRENLRKAREDFSNQLNNKTGLENLIGLRVASQLLLNSASFMIIDEKTKEERFLTMDEKKNFVELLQKQVKLTPDMLEILLDPKQTNEQTIIQNAIKERVVESFSSKKSSSGSLPILDPTKLQDETTLKGFSIEINTNYLKSQQIAAEASTSLKTYKELSENLISNVNANYKNGSIQTLQDSFKEGGMIHSVSKTLLERAQALTDELRSLKESTIVPEQIRQEITNANTKELEAINSLQKNISNLSTSIGGAASNFSARKAVNEFSASVEQNKEVKQGFFGTLLSAIGSAFAPKKPKELDASSETLHVIQEKLVSKIPTTDTISKQEQDKLLDVLREVGMEKDQEIQKPSYDPALPNSTTNQPPPPNFSPPPRPTLETEKPKQSHVEKLAEQKGINSPKTDLLQEVKDRKGQLKTKEKVVDMNVDGFTYIPEIGKSTKPGRDLGNALKQRRGAIDPENQVNDLLENKSQKAQLNVLYSAIINGSSNLIENIIEHGSQKVFNKKNCQKIYEAAVSIKDKVAPEKKVILEKGLKTLSEEVKLDVKKDVISR